MEGASPEPSVTDITRRPSRHQGPFTLRDPPAEEPESFLDRILNHIDNPEQYPLPPLLATHSSPQTMPPATRSTALRQPSPSPHLEISDSEADDSSDSDFAEEVIEEQPRKRRRLAQGRSLRYYRTGRDTDIDSEDLPNASGTTSAGEAPTTTTIAPSDANDADEPPAQSTTSKLISDAIRSQNSPSSPGRSASGKPLKLGDLTCVICMDHITDITATACGHVFCHECLMQAIIASENRGPDVRRGQCPVCRKWLNRSKVSAATGIGDFSTLLLKKRGPRTVSLREVERGKGKGK